MKPTQATAICHCDPRRRRCTSALRLHPACGSTARRTRQRPFTSVFKDSRIVATNHFTEARHEVHGRPAGSVMTVAVEIAGQSFTALNGGPAFKFNEAISFQVHCETQDEIDYFWARLPEGGEEGQCGWLKDRFGVSWQIVPAVLAELFTEADPKKSGRAMQAMLRVKKLAIAELKRA